MEYAHVPPMGRDSDREVNNDSLWSELTGLETYGRSDAKYMTVLEKMMYQASIITCYAARIGYDEDEGRRVRKRHERWVENARNPTETVKTAQRGQKRASLR